MLVRAKLTTNKYWNSSSKDYRLRSANFASSAPSLIVASAMGVAADAPVRVFSAEEDPVGAKACCDTVGKGFATEPNNHLFCPDPALFEYRWRVIASNSLLRSPKTPLLHSVGPEGQEHAAVAFAYSYPEQRTPDDAPEPPGIIDLSETGRPDSLAVRDDLLSYIALRKDEFLQRQGPFEYVAFLACLPEWQGSGLGSRLLRHITSKADAAGRWSYLEATNDDNVRLYSRHGFRPIETKEWTLDSVPGERVKLILMERPPAAAAAQGAAKD